MTPSIVKNNERTTAEDEAEKRHWDDVGLLALADRWEQEEDEAHQRLAIQIRKIVSIRKSRHV